MSPRHTDQNVQKSQNFAVFTAYLASILKVLIIVVLWPLDIQQSQDYQQYELFSASWKPDGRRFEQIGRYKMRVQYWELWNGVFPNEKYHFNGRHIRIITNFVSLMNL